MSYEKTEPTADNRFVHDPHWHLMLCRATNCTHNQGDKPLCTLDTGLEFDERGQCIHFKADGLMEITVGPALFKFENFTQWVNHATRWYGNQSMPTSRMVSIDTAGRICTCGAHFMKARDEKAFPVTVYCVEPDDN